MKDDLLYVGHMHDAIERIVWNIIEKDLPQLQQTINSILEELR